MGWATHCRHALRLPRSQRAHQYTLLPIQKIPWPPDICGTNPSVGRSGRSSLASTVWAATGKKQYGAVRPVPITVLTITSNQKKDPAVVYANEWLDKLSRFVKVEQVTLKPNPTGAKDPEQAKAEESKRVLASIQKSSSTYTVCLDERGKDATSESLADILEKASDSGCTSICFMIGGPFGWKEEVRSASDETIRLSRCVLNHAVANVVLAEQLYRAWTIVRGEPYHH